ncbi:MAG: peptidylprolyl isomerase [Chromatiales bacterium]|jgi:FKBP-type peptidyl-prolyl cis-trans isomerase SlyD
MQIEKHKVVSLNYTLRDEQGEILDQSAEGEPLVYLHGAQDIIPGLEQALEGRAAGESLRVVVPPDQAYGDYEQSLVEVVSRQQFPGIDEIQPGMQFQTTMDDGAPMVIRITSVEGDAITVDGNHPLAGLTLVFEVEVADVRQASEEEIAHGHVHHGDGCDVH